MICLIHLEVGINLLLDFKNIQKRLSMTFNCLKRMFNLSQLNCLNFYLLANNFLSSVEFLKKTTKVKT